MGDIQRRGRFIKQQTAAILRHQHGDPRPLTLAAGETVHQPLRQRLQPHQRDRLFHLFPIRRAEAPQRAMPRVATYRHQLANCHPFRRRQLLRQIGHFAGKRLATPALQRLAVQQHLARGRRLMAAEHFQ
ncbi:Uncharacterised protein [Klebsiella pneumoniae]|nr:Uncharacterised protein [Klebsiella pneumoniae]